MDIWPHLQFDRAPLRIAVLLLAVTLLPAGQTAATAQDSGASNRPLFGVAINARVIEQLPDFLTYYGVESVTPDNAMKMEVIGGCDGVFDFSAADRLLDYAEQRGFQVHGHTVVWHKQTSWCADTFTRADFESYVRTVVGNFCGRVASMDIVNEALGSRTRYRTAEESVWKRLYGNEEYIFDAFRWARESCPEMKLYYNDYLIEWGPKSTRMLGLVRRLADEGLIDGVGFQSHLDLNAKLDEFAQVMDEVAALGLEFAVSELDVRLARPYWELTGDDLQAQAEIYREVARLCRERPACVRLTVWGIDDGHSWINTDPEFGGVPDAPLLFDRDYWPKPAYCTGIREVLSLPPGDCPA
jgi:endo-1,4-beta-xylanase